MKEHWHPSIKLVDISERYIEFILKHSVNINEVPSLVTKANHKLGSFKIMMMIIMGIKLVLALGLTV
jgi:hypothetical protein